jgi:hypothetical protein
MKLFTKYLIFLIIILIINGCDKPASTELIQKEEEPLSVEVITKDTDDEFYIIDSSGVVVDDLNRFVNVITVSGIKISNENTTINTSFAQAIFFDRSRPIYRRNERLLTYHTRVLGDVQFNNVPAELKPLNIRYKDGSITNEINLGFRHVLNSLISGQSFNYDFSSSVAFNIDFFPLFGGASLGFDIPTPSEITGKLRFEGNRVNNSLRAVLRWNGEHHSKFEIIIGASINRNEKVFPLFRLRTKDDGELIIPPNLINRIPHRFNNIVFSFVRKIESHHEGNNNDLYVLSQSIHSLVVDIP